MSRFVQNQKLLFYRQKGGKKSENILNRLIVGALCVWFCRWPVHSSLLFQDDRYWARRRKNNVAAKRSRDARRLKENQIAIRAGFLEKENAALRMEVADMRKELGRCKNIVAKYEARHGPLWSLHPPPTHPETRPDPLHRPHPPSLEFEGQCVSFSGTAPRSPPPPPPLTHLYDSGIMTSIISFNLSVPSLIFCTHRSTKYIYIYIYIHR